MRGQYDIRIAKSLNIRPEQVKTTIALIDDGNTIPFIARYRKEMTLNLDEFQIREVESAIKRMRTIDERRDTILTSIIEQGKLTPSLNERIESAETLTELEDLYLPYKPKRRTRASIAIEAGLERLAQYILAQDKVTSPATIAEQFLTNTLTTIDDALAGARDIVAEHISNDVDIRNQLRQRALKWGVLYCKRVPQSPDERETYKIYYEFNQAIGRLRPHQILAINRGEEEKILRVKIEVAERDVQHTLNTSYREINASKWREELAYAKQDALKRLLLPAIERDIRRELTQDAENHAIKVFASNLRGLLTQPPLVGQVIMGIDPAYRTGCKIAIIDSSGKVIATSTIYPHAPQNQREQALTTLSSYLDDYRVTLIAIGNGTASRETESLIASITRQRDDVFYMIVNEAGASVYSASDLAREELPHLDVSIRGAVSIARRAQDPLAELVKIDPRSIGIGLYQHDVNQNTLSEALHAVVESVVNQVGVDVNTASPALLQYVAGIGNKVAVNIQEHRNEYGAFSSRQDLRKVKGIGNKVFEQCAGFLRIRNAENPLDDSAIHPESYATAERIMQLAQIRPQDKPSERHEALKTLHNKGLIDAVKEALGVGTLTLQDILEQLARPSRDPRENVPAPILRKDVMSIDDLSRGQVLMGTVRNCVDFGAFVDIGVKQDGLLHISQLPKHVSLQVGDVIQVEIINIEKERSRIGLGWRQNA